MILITGATGHIGNVVARKLIDQSCRVRALIFPTEDLAPLADLDIECVPGDVLSPTAVERAMRGVRSVFHLAGVISIQPGANTWMRQVNVDGTRNMLAAAMKAGVERFVFTSSIHALGRLPHGVTIDENAPFDAHSEGGGYDCSKAEASLAVQEAARVGFPAVIACPTGVIGPHDYRRSEMGRLIVSGMKPRLQWMIAGAYDFVDVRDVADGLISALKKGRCGETYILSGEQIEMGLLLRLVQKASGIHAPVVRVPLPLAKAAASLAPLYSRIFRRRPLVTAYSIETVQSNSVVSCAKARAELDYRPRSLVESVADTVRWLREYQHP